MFRQQFPNKEPFFGSLHALTTRLSIDKLPHQDPSLGFEGAVAVGVSVFEFSLVDEFGGYEGAFAIGDWGLGSVADYCPQVVGFVWVEQEGVGAVDVLLFDLGCDYDGQIAIGCHTLDIEQAFPNRLLVLDIPVQIELIIQTVIPFEPDILTRIGKTGNTFYNMVIGKAY